jgi:alkylated DNA repair dioxygenase AlkB
MFDAPPVLPEGFRYGAGLIAAGEEARLIESLQDLPFREFEFQGFLGKRRVVSFGWKYDFNTHELRRADDIPPFLHGVRAAAAKLFALDAARFQRVLVTEYRPGAAIGWHKDRPIFGEVMGVSLFSPCTFRLRRKTGTTWQRASLVAEPRSVYLLQGPARTDWEHSIPAVDRLRYSITFRNFLAKVAPDL